MKVVYINLLFMALLWLGNTRLFAQEGYNLKLVTIPELTGADYTGCSDSVGEPIVDVHQKITNDIALGSVGKVWARQKSDRSIKIYPTSVANRYCAVLESSGKFKTIRDALSPAGVTYLAGTESGDFVRVQVAYISSRYFTIDRFAPKGDLGEFDYNCSSETGECPGYQDWVSMYFPVYFSWTDWIGTKYVAKDGQFWSHIQNTFSGDIN